MFQIIFNELSAAEMSALPKTLQLDLLAEFQILPEDLDNLDSSRFGVIEREGKKLHRYRAKEYRIYFERTPEVNRDLYRISERTDSALGHVRLGTYGQSIVSIQTTHSRFAIECGPNI